MLKWPVQRDTFNRVSERLEGRQSAMPLIFQALTIIPELGANTEKEEVKAVLVCNIAEILKC